MHGVDGYESSCSVGSLGDGSHVVHGTDRVRRQAYGYEFRPFVDVLLQVVLVEGEGLGIYPDPAHSRPLLCGGDQPGVHVGAVVELCDVGLRARWEDAVQVRPAALHVARDGVDSLPRYLRAAWSVEVNDAATIMSPADRRELLADGLYVKRTLHKSSHLETSCPASLYQAGAGGRCYLTPYSGTKARRSFCQD